MALPARLHEGDDPIWQLLVQADEVGVRLEMVGGTSVWEAFPGVKHQGTVNRIVRSLIKNESLHQGCVCHTYPDIYIRFPDGSLKRPDLSIYCEEIEEVSGATDQVPTAVFEVLSPGYESKDLHIGVPFYLANGVPEVILIAPVKRQAVHHTARGAEQISLPQRLILDCGCVVDLDIK